VSPKLFQGIVVAFLVAIPLLAIAPWEHSSAAGLDLERANSALALAAPGAGVQISNDEFKSDNYPSGETSPGAYPAAPSFAKGMTPEWHRYAAMVDRVCALSWNYMQVVKARAARQAYRERWTQNRAVAAEWRFTSDEDARILQATHALGVPPAEQALFASWQANVETRSDLFERASQAAANGNFKLVRRICRRITRLKTQADALGQRFGLRICTSN
jgi:hypothetical protein